MRDPFAGAAAGTDPLAWVGLGIALVLLSSFGLARPIKLTLYAVILYVLLTHGPAVAAGVDRLTAALRVKSSSSSGGGGAGGRLLVR